MYDITRPLLSFKQIFTINVKYTHTYIRARTHTHTTDAYINTYAFTENKLHSFIDKTQ